MLTEVTTAGELHALERGVLVGDLRGSLCDQLRAFQHRLLAEADPLTGYSAIQEAGRISRLNRGRSGLRRRGWWKLLSGGPGDVDVKHSPPRPTQDNESEQQRSRHSRHDCTTKPFRNRFAEYLEH